MVMLLRKRPSSLLVSPGTSDLRKQQPAPFLLQTSCVKTHVFRVQRFSLSMVQGLSSPQKKFCPFYCLQDEKGYDPSMQNTIDLSQCDTEPIRFINSIQAFGALVVLDEES